jgi:hypothetical protein
MPELWLERLAAEFWEAAGGNEPFPRTLESSVIWALPVAIVKLPGLSVTAVEKWLTDRNMHAKLDSGNRRLHGCVLAFGGKGVILLDEGDSADELRFSLAHEAAHFIVDYISPRKIAEERFGVQILEVLDGCRPPTVQERGSALLSNTAIGVYKHLMDRSVDGKIQCSRVEHAERDADRLALELLAPEQIVQSVLKSRPTAQGSTRSLIVNCLKEYFGLPDPIAIRYSFRFASASKPQSVRDWLGIR